LRDRRVAYGHQSIRLDPLYESEALPLAPIAAKLAGRIKRRFECGKCSVRKAAAGEANDQHDRHHDRRDEKQ
jgi:hypothetical protein